MLREVEKKREKGDTVKRGMFVALIALLTMQAVPSGQSAQTADQSGRTADQPAPPVENRPGTSPEKRRQAIKMMEVIFSRAVLGGAEHLAEQLGSGNPNVSFFTGQARARGFILDGYGVFFHVEIPEMQQSLVMSVAALERDLAVGNTLESLRRAVDSFPDGGPKLVAEQLLKRLEVQVGPVPTMADTGAVARDRLRPANTTDTQLVAPLPPVAAIPSDPNAAYREAIKSALIDAMLEHSRGINLQPDEWLSIAAHRGDSTLSPNEIVTSPTLVLRIKGSDLAIYDTDRTRKDEIRKRVDVKEF